jgi:hypothetical protein
MAFKAVKGKWGLRWWPKTASTAFSVNTLVAVNAGTGFFIPASSTTDFNLGILRKAVTSSDSDYASNTRLPIECPMSPYAEMEGDVSTGTLATTSVGEYFNLTDAAGVDQSSGSNRSVLCTGFISASKGLFVLNSNAATRPAV